MAKKKKRSGGGGGGGEGGGGGGGGQQQKPAAEASGTAEEGEEQAVAANNDASDEAAAEDNKNKDHNKDKGKDQENKDSKDKGKKPPPPLPVVTAVLKVDMHCDGCAKRIRGSVHRYPGKAEAAPFPLPPSLVSLFPNQVMLIIGVEGVAMEVDKGTMTVVGRFDAKKLRDRVAKKTRKKVDLVGNNNAGNKGGGGNNKGGGGGGSNQQKGASEEDGKPEKEHDGEKEDKGKGKDDHQEEDKGKDNKGGGGGGNGGGGKGKGGGKDNKKPTVPVVGTVVLKIGSTGLHCEGCMNRIRSKLFKIRGVEQVKMDMAKNQVTVTGTMDAKALPEKLRKKLRRPVDVVPAKDGKQQDGGGGKDKDGKEKDGGKDAATKKLTAELEAWKAAFYDQQSLTNLRQVHILVSSS
ncbi:uncharacterized protein C2845_PM12G31050 [Panicum miliaceum]|uniref:HMA domain-containing protein n=1 Tax=Panicum miliaceum TaxID=4540 RepID=A0A3L6QKB8_PANMI|nr:uncharacterized protein C2845_PM12G31050 [Panicum miliaceum]